MKNIKYIAVLFCLLVISTFSYAQSTLDNGRPEGVVAAPVVEAENTTSNANSNTGNNGGDTFSDQDVPGEEAPEEEDTFYPTDFDIMQDEVMASTNPVDLAIKINELNDLANDLHRMVEELRLENQTIRESLGNCCSNSALGLTAHDAYLLQNAPNPFNESSVISYFVPRGLENVEIRISDIKGELLRSIQVEEAGYGKLEVAASALSTGSFIYMLSVDGEVVDSKVMIITQ